MTEPPSPLAGTPPESAPPTPPVRSPRRTAAIALLIVSAVFAGSALLLVLAELVLPPDVVPPEALFLFAVPAAVFGFGWWFVGLLILTGCALLPGVPRARSVLLFGLIVAVAWAAAVFGFAQFTVVL